MNNYGEPWTIMNFVQCVPGATNSKTGQPIMTTEDWTTVFDDSEAALHCDFAYNESPFRKDLLPRIVACVNALRNLTDEEVAVIDGISISDRGVTA